MDNNTEKESFRQHLLEQDESLKIHDVSDKLRVYISYGSVVFRGNSSIQQLSPFELKVPSFKMTFWQRFNWLLFGK